MRKVLIVELKRGGFELTQEGLDQARNYAKEIRREASIGSAAPIVAYVLGASLEAGLGPGRYGEPLWTDVTPVRYDTLWNRAHARTFNLQRRLDSTPVRRDAEVEEVISGGSLLGGQLPLQ